jgi:tungstate transport system substrate-binding protein
MIRAIIIIGLILFSGLSGCLEKVEDSEELLLATTTSMRDSGLLDELLPAFEKATGIHVNVVAVGTGAALNLGENGDADLLIVHSPQKEIEFIENGFGTSRSTFAWNRFVLIGPNKLAGFSNASEAFSSLENECFVSRGDNSGTHIKELEIWEIADIKPSKDYLSIGQGMASALNMADELQCWTLSDKGTWLFRSNELDLEATSWDDDLTLNPYSMIQLKGEKSEESLLLHEFIMSFESQEIISNYLINGQTLFNAGQPPSNIGSNELK